MKEYRMSLPKLFEKLIQVFGSISAISGKKILVIRDLEVALMLSIRNAVVYITDDEECAEAFRKNTEAGMGDDDKVFFINNYKTELKELLNDMHFDVAVQNPPYDRNLHLKILAEVLDHADKVINISPVRWLQDPFAPYSTRSDYCKFEDSVSKKIESIDVISAKEASELFDAKFVMNLGIYVCGNGGYEYRHNDPMITKIVQKTMTSNWEPFSWRREQQVKPYKLICSYVAGSATAGFDYLVCKTYEAQLKSKPTNPEWKPGGHDHREFYFDTETERYNFWACYNHPFMRWWARQWKADFAIRANQVPYFGDYTHPWDYKDFFTWFELTEAEQERIMREIAEMQAE